MVAAAQEDCGAALERLCGIYWPAVYEFARRSGNAEEDARDLTQGFFAELLAKRWLEGVDADRGRFRSWLAAAFSNYARSEWRKSQRVKRGGGAMVLSLDDGDFSGAARDVSDPALTPDEAYVRGWARSLVRAAVQRLTEEYDAAGKASLFAALRPFITGDRGEVSYAEAAAGAGMSESAVRSAIHRMRQRYGEIFRDEVAQTVDGPAEVEDEIRCLLAVVGR
jgi:RNA polymerase sigma-70 factor (ECF subfamily)